MKKKQLFWEMLDIVTSLSNRTQAEIAPEVGIKPNYLSILKTNSKEGTEPPNGFMRRFKAKYALYLEGTATRRIKLEDIAADYLNRVTRMEAYQIVLMEEIAVIKAKLKKLEDPTADPKAKTELLDLANRVTVVVAKLASEWKPLS